MIRNEKGFTLLDMLFVCGLIGNISVIAPDCSASDFSITEFEFLIWSAPGFLFISTISLPVDMIATRGRLPTFTFA